MNFDQIIRQFIVIYLVPIIRKAVREELEQYDLTSKDSNTEELLTAKESAAYIGDALPTFYRRTSQREIATYGSGKRLFCKRSELDAWKQKHRTKSMDQIQEEVDRSLSKIGTRKRRRL